MKTCFKCKQSLPVDSFYRHSKMADGHLGKCIECTKSDVKERRALKLLDPNWVDKERSRCRSKTQKARSQGVSFESDPEVKFESTKRYRADNPLKWGAHKAVANAIKTGALTSQSCSVCGSIRSQAHHEDYAKPLDVVWLCSKHHGERHVELRRQSLLNI